MPDESQPGARIFISYAHEDEDLKQELDKHLKVLKRSSKVDVWSDRQLVAGEEWDDSIMSELQRANIILLLISVDFNASDFIWDKELAVAMERHRDGTARVVPIIMGNAAGTAFRMPHCRRFRVAPAPSRTIPTVTSRTPRSRRGSSSSSIR